MRFIRTLKILSLLGLLAICIHGVAVSQLSNAAGKPDRAVSFNISLPNGATAQVTALEGQMATVTVNDKSLGITPHVVDSGSGKVLLLVSQILRDKEGEELVEPLREFRLSIGDPPVSLEWSPQLQIQIVKIVNLSQNG